MARGVRSARATRKVYKALLRKGYDTAKAGAIANAGKTHARRSLMVSKGNQTRRHGR